MAQKQIPPRDQFPVKGVNGSRFGVAVKIDDDVPAHDDITFADEPHHLLIHEVQMSEMDHVPDGIVEGIFTILGSVEISVDSVPVSDSEG